MIQALLQKSGHDVRIVGNGALAVDALTSDRYDIVLMDIQMPVMDGISATGKSVRCRALLETPIVALTANALKHMEEEYVTAGMNDFVPKPIEPERLGRVLHEQCGSGLGKTDQPIVPVSSSAPTKDTPVVSHDELSDFLGTLDDLDL